MGVTVIPQPRHVVEGDGRRALVPAIPSIADGHEPEGYVLEIDEHGIRIEASDEAGLFYGEQTLRQLDTDGTVPFVRIEDAPRFAYRGAMLDVARHFLPVEAVQRYIDDIALLKLNHLHLHLTDDQGWRLEIPGWPELTGIGASTQVGGGGGGYYTAHDYRRIVEYAARRFVTILPEIDMPGHTNAAISAYPDLGDSPADPYEGIEVGFSSLAIGSERTYDFIADVTAAVAALTPGPYLHLGGDESHATSEEDYLAFAERATAIAARTGKTLVAWHELGRSRALPPGTIGQYWGFVEPQDGADALARSFVEQGGRLILSPADAIYLDMKYETDGELGLVWANGPTTLERSYSWEPLDVVPGLTEHDILGVEAPLWTETVTSIEDAEYLAFPRIASAAEIGWSPRDGRTFEDFARRVRAFSDLLERLGIPYGP